MHFKKTEYVWLHILAAISQELEAKAREKKWRICNQIHIVDIKKAKRVHIGWNTC